MRGPLTTANGHRSEPPKPPSLWEGLRAGTPQQGAPGGHAPRRRARLRAPRY